MAEKLYDTLASWWPRLSPPGDYAPEAGALIELMQAVLPDDGQVPAVLELGAGGGHTLVHLVEAGCQAVAVDLSDAMLANCRQLVPDVETVVGDMRTLRLDRAFDVVLIHDAIDYLTTASDVQATLTTAAMHLKPGGLLVVAPTYVTETFTDGETASDSNDGLAYVSRVARISDQAIELTMVMMLHENGTMRVEEDRHVCGLFDESQWAQWITDAGLSPVDLAQLPTFEKTSALAGYQPFAAIR